MRRIWLAILGLTIAAGGFGFTGPWRASVTDLVSRPGSASADTPATCATIDPSWNQIDVPLASTSVAPSAGRVLSLSDGTIAVLVIVDSLTSDGQIGAVDFSTSIKVTAAFVKSAKGVELKRYDPSVRSASGIAASDSSALSSISLCYRISIPAPPAPATPGQTPTPISPPPSPTSVEFDLGAVQTARAEVAVAAGDAKETAVSAQTVVAQAQATVAAQASQIAMLQATVSAPTTTPTALPEGNVLFSASSDADFAQLSLPTSGWRINNGLVADGSAAQDWVELPAISNLGADQAIEAEIKIGGGGNCPRNFGLALRGADTGFVAGGVEWACDQAVKLWAGQAQLAQAPSPKLGNGWHLFRLEVRGNSVRLLVDGVVALESTTTQSTGNQLAIWSGGVPLTVRSIRVIGLP